MAATTLTSTASATKTSSVTTAEVERAKMAANLKHQACQMKVLGTDNDNNRSEVHSYLQTVAWALTSRNQRANINFREEFQQGQNQTA